MLRNGTDANDVLFSEMERNAFSIKHYGALTNVYEHIEQD